MRSSKTAALLPLALAAWVAASPSPGLPIGLSAGCGAPGPPAPAASPASPASPPAPEAPPPRRLRVALYPYVPGYEAIKAVVAAEFARARPGTSLELVDLDRYYDPDAEGSILRVDADVVEIDSVFIDELLPSLRPLPASVGLDPEDFHPAAASVGRKDGIWYAAPHWLCAHFLFAPREIAPRLGSFEDIEREARASLPDKGLLVDLRGSSTLGELFLGAQADALGGLAPALASLPAPRAAALDLDLDRAPGLPALMALRRLCRGEICREEAESGDPAELARRLARKEGVAMVGYAEALSAFVGEARRGCGGQPCLAEDALEVLPLALSPAGDSPFVWVDALGIKASCAGACLEDASAFLAMMSRDDVLRALVLPEGEPPRYLLPAKRTLDAELAREAPYYAQLLPRIALSPAARGPGLGRALRRVGEQVDRALDPLDAHVPRAD